MADDEQGDERHADLDEPTLALKEQWRQEQDALALRLETGDRFTEPLRYVGGVDISFVKGDAVRAAACLVVLDANDSYRVCYKAIRAVDLTQPYVPGFLAFREVPFLLALLDELRAASPELMPQMLFVDGNGVLHTRGFGLASHLGVLADLPTIGVGKTFFHVDGLDLRSVRAACDSKLSAGGQWLPLVGESGRTWGAAVRPTDDAIKPVFVSIGHRVCLESAVRLALAVSVFRVPEPIRAADQESRAFLRTLAASNASSASGATGAPPTAPRT